jgi:hypothetical protein
MSTFIPSTALLSVTVQAQDQVSSQGMLVNTNPPQIVFPAPSNLQYSGYIKVISTSQVNIFTGLTPGCPFAYMRNASAGGSNALSCLFTPTGGALEVLPLAPGGIFVFANPTAGPDPITTLSQFGYSASVVNAPVVMEFFWAS